MSIREMKRILPLTFILFLHFYLRIQIPLKTDVPGLVRPTAERDMYLKHLQHVISSHDVYVC